MSEREERHLSIPREKSSGHIQASKWVDSNVFLISKIPCTWVVSQPLVQWFTGGEKDLGRTERKEKGTLMKSFV